MKKSAILVILTAVVCFSLTAFRPEQPAPAAVRTVTAVAGSSLVSVSASGALEPYRTRTLGVAGYAVADRVYLNVGEEVREGQVIMTFAAAENPAAALDIEEIAASADISGLLDGDVASALGDSVADVFSASELVSPFDGVITAINIEEGEQAAPLSVLAEVSDFSRVRARVRLSEEDFAAVSVGMPADVTSGGETFRAVVIEVSPMVRSSSTLTGGSERYGEAVLELYDPSGALVGSSATAKIYTERRSGVISVPFAAVDQDAQNREFVYVLDGGRARIRYVTSGREFGNNLEIASGLSDGEAVIVDASAALTDGCTVEVER